MAVSGPTVLRLMRTHAVPPLKPVRVLGIGDWAWKKGQTYGTILVDLERGKPIELLPDRTEETAETWLRTHPEVEIVSRDRGGRQREKVLPKRNRWQTNGRAFAFTRFTPIAFQAALVELLWDIHRNVSFVWLHF